MLEAEAARFVGASRWQFASTMPQFPHEYTLKRWCDPEEFEAFVQHIQTAGTLCRKTFWERIYLDVGDRYYWYMDENPQDVTLINRARMEDDSEVLRMAQDRR